MNNRKKLITIVLLLCMALMIFGTTAFLNNTFFTTNVVSTGGVDIAVSETNDNNIEKVFDGDSIAENRIEFKDIVMPGTSVTDTVVVKNIGKSTAYIRVKVGKSFNLKSNVICSNSDLIKLIYGQNDGHNTDYWQEINGYYYYKYPLAAGEATQPLFNKIVFSEEMNDTYYESKAEVLVRAEATQSKNNSSSAVNAAGWPAEEVTNE